MALPLYEQVVDFLASAPPADQIVAYRLSAEAQDRFDELYQRHTAGSLSDADRAELETFLKLDHIVTLAKAKARLRMPPK